VRVMVWLFRASVVRFGCCGGVRPTTTGMCSSLICVQSKHQKSIDSERDVPGAVSLVSTIGRACLFPACPIVQ
jgi:hypothetical protein